MGSSVIVSFAESNDKLELAGCFLFLRPNIAPTDGCLNIDGTAPAPLSSSSSSEPHAGILESSFFLFVSIGVSLANTSYFPQRNVRVFFDAILSASVLSRGACDKCK
jgi:hypothetical protein